MFGYFIAAGLVLTWLELPLTGKLISGGAAATASDLWWRRARRQALPPARAKELRP
jgi:hypothetical protein